MTTNQTIDGVPRHTLRLALAGIEYLALRADDIGTSSVQLTAELRALLDAPTVEPVPITDDMNRLMVAYKNGEFGLEDGSETVEALSVASFDAVESHGHDADSYMAGYCAAMYEQIKPFLWLALHTRATQPQGAPVAVVLPERLTPAELEELEVIEALIHGQGLSNLAGTMAAARQFIDEVTRLNPSL